MMRRGMIGALVLCGIAVSWGWSASSVEKSQEAAVATDVTVDRVLDRYIQACGGERGLGAGDQPSLARDGGDSGSRSARDV
jgi:hypothetical protein